MYMYNYASNEIFHPTASPTRERERREHQGKMIGILINPTINIESDIFLSGVPQGSVLGPLLLLLFINALSDCLVRPVGVKIFADDTKLYFAHGDCKSDH